MFINSVSFLKIFPSIPGVLLPLLLFTRLTARARALKDLTNVFCKFSTLSLLSSLQAITILCCSFLICIMHLFQSISLYCSFFAIFVFAGIEWYSIPIINPASFIATWLALYKSASFRIRVWYSYPYHYSKAFAFCNLLLPAPMKKVLPLSVFCS